ncbi:MAG TPA: DinB family protein [Gemmatimonadaceae bacterium]
MNASAAKTAAQIYLQDFESEIPTTVRLLQSIPASNLSYAPDAKSKTGLALCRHLVLNDLWLLDGVASGSYKPVPDASDACGLMTPADCAAHYAREMPSALQRIQERADEELARDIGLFGVYKMPAVSYLSMALRHSIHHRGQLSSYARAMGGKVPAIYGPSADSAEA